MAEKKSRVHESINSFAQLIVDTIKSDRWALIVCDGSQGEGKSCFTSQLAKEIVKINKTPFSYDDNMTYLRSDLKTWVDGDEKGKGQKKEGSVILCDEVISMFFKRNWYDKNQINGIELLNKCRDRHLCIMGDLPNFWDLDSAIYPITTYWVHIHKRKIAWVFEKDKNPFIKDKWNISLNSKLFAKFNNPYRCRGFVCEINFNDWGDKEKKDYYSIRNIKRKNSEGQRETIKKNQFRFKEQRDKLIRAINLNGVEVAKLIGCTKGEISIIRNIDIEV